MPQLSPMMGVIVFVLTNISFITLVVSIRSSMNVSSLKMSVLNSANKAFRGFS